MPDLPISVRAAQAVGIFGTLFTAGLSTGINLFVIPAILQSPTHLLLSQWKVTYTRGSRIVPILAVMSSTSLAYVSYYYRPSHNYKAWAIASAMAISIIPYTFIVVFPTNYVLEGWHKKDGQGVDRTEVAEKIGEWSYKQSARSCLTLAGGLLALFAILQ